jgi:hypothetical protein
MDVAHDGTDAYIDDGFADCDHTVNDGHDAGRDGVEEALKLQDGQKALGRP